MDTRRPIVTRQDRPEAAAKKWIKWSLGIIGGIVALITIFGCFYTIDQYERGILTRNGAFVSILKPGFGMKMPWIDNVTQIDIRIKTYQWKNMEAYSNDQQPAHMLISVTAHPNEGQLGVLYEDFRTVDNAVQQLLSPIVNQQSKIVFGKYTSTRAIQERAKFNSDVMEAVITSLGNKSVLLIKSVQIEDVSFSGEYMKSIEQRMKVEVDVQKQRQEWEKEKINADIVRTKANAEADAIKARGNAEAEAIKAKAKALAENPRLIELEAAQRWNGELPTTMVPNAAVPMLTLPSK